MKIRLTPELSYLIGLWKVLKINAGLGISGDKDVLNMFIKLALEQGLTEPNKFQMDENKVYFYHTKYKKFFYKITDSELEKFKYINDYSGNFVAGLYDAGGEITDRGIVRIRGLNKTDEILLMRLGFLTERRKDYVVIMKPRIFLRFIKPYLKIRHVPDEFANVKRRNARKRVVSE